MKTKTPYLTLPLLLNLSILMGQISSPLGQLLYEDSLVLDPLHEFIEIPNSDSNIWEIGIPSYEDIDSTFSGLDALFIDTSIFSLNHREQYFLIYLPAADSGWGEGILSFYHNFYSDSLLNGGFIEVSYDNGQSWVNIINDVNHINHDFIGLYNQQDTILGMIPAYSGRANSWVYTEFYWHWIALLKKTTYESYGRPIVKFQFNLNTNNKNLNTWIIDDLVVRGYSIVGSTNNLKSQDVNIFPNPVSKILHIQVPTTSQQYELEIYNLTGEKVYQKSFMQSTNIDVSFLESSQYLILMKLEGILISSTKFIKN